MLVPLILSASDTPKIISISDYGAVGDGVTNDLPALRKALKAAGSNAILSIPKGNYLLNLESLPISTKKALSPDGTRLPSSLLYLEGVDHLVIRGEQESNIICNSPNATVLVLRNCSNVTIENLTIDFDPLPFTQGDIIETEAAGKSGQARIRFKVDQGYPSPIFPDVQEGSERLQKQGAVYPKGLYHPRYSIWWKEVNMVSEGVFDVSATVRYKEALPIHEPGEKIVLISRNNGAMGLGIWNSWDVVVRNVDIRASGGGGIIVRNGFRTTISNCRIAPPENSGRLNSTNADAINIHNSTFTTITKCRIVRNNDDSINHTAHGLLVLDAPSPTELVVAWDATMIRPDHPEPPFTVGHEVTVYHAESGTARGRAKVVSVTKAVMGARSVVRLVLSEPLTGVKSIPEEYLAKKNRDADRFADFDYVIDGTYSSNAFVISDNTIEHTSDRLLVAEEGGVIKGNTMDDVDGNLQIGQSATWGIIAAARKLVIENNTFRNTVAPTRASLDSLRGTITVENFGYAGKDSITVPKKEITNEGIEIRGNTFEGFGQCGVSINNSRNVIIESNRFIAPDTRFEANPVLFLKSVSGITLRNNLFPSGSKAVGGLGDMESKGIVTEAGQ